MCDSAIIRIARSNWRKYDLYASTGLLPVRIKKIKEWTAGGTLFQANNKEYFKSPYRWILVSGDTEELKVLENLDALVDSDVVVMMDLNNTFLFTEGKTNLLSS